MFMTSKKILPLLITLVPASAWPHAEAQDQMEYPDVEPAEALGDPRIDPLGCTMHKLKIPPLSIFKRLCPAELRPNFDTIIASCEDGNLKLCTSALQRWAPAAAYECATPWPVLARTIISCL